MLTRGGGLARRFCVAGKHLEDGDIHTRTRKDDLDVMKRIALQRFSVKEYSSEPLADGLLEELLAITQVWYHTTCVMYILFL